LVRAFGGSSVYIGKDDWRWLLKPISEKSRLIREKGAREDARRAGVKYVSRVKRVIAK
jgi:hypothetical protein